MPAGRASPSAIEIASWCVTAASLVLVLWLHLLPSLLAGLLVFELIHVLAPPLRRHLSHQRSRLAAVGLLAALIVGLVTVTILGAGAVFRRAGGRGPGLRRRRR